MPICFVVASKATDVSRCGWFSSMFTASSIFTGAVQVFVAASYRVNHTASFSVLCVDM